jgi:hypothetical protein
MNVGELIEELSQYPKDWTVGVGYEGTSNSLQFVSAYPDGYRKPVTDSTVAYYIQRIIDRGEESPTEDAVRERLESFWLIEPQTVIVGTY